MKKSDFPKLYAITDSRLMPAEQLQLRVEAALKGGCRLIQYRDKSPNPAKRIVEAEQLLRLCKRYNALLIINDDIDLTLSVKANGVHLGQGDAGISEARQRLGRDAIIGITCHDNITLAQEAETAGADYVAFGRFFSSNTKPDANAAPLELVQTARSQISVPIVVIGGICRDNAQQLIANGCDSIAISHGLFAVDDIAAEAEYLLSLFPAHN